MVIDERFYIGKASDRSAIRMVRWIKRVNKINRHTEKNFLSGARGHAKRYVSRKTPIGLYVVTLPVFGDGILEIYDINELTQRTYAVLGDSIHIVGAAETRLQAMLVVRDIVEDIYNKTGGVDVAGFFAGQAI